ncbi:MAG: DUF1501 domain-containing protein [Cyclobacteriaceae bacterium]
MPKFLQANPFTEFNGKRLVVIQFSGGNDGLNTVIPFNNDLLYQVRPTLAPSKNNVLKITDELGLNSAMTGLRSLFDDGDVCILNGVGYPNPSRSHFRSMDIWQSGSSAEEYWSSGWLGRYLDNECENPDQLTAVEMNNILSLAMKGERLKGLPVTNINQFYRSAQQITSDRHEDHEHPMASFLHKTLADTKNSAQYLFEKNKIYSSARTYPNNVFARQLKEVAEMIISGVESPVYYISLGGFDTHNNQEPRQKRLLDIYSEALKVFADDLKQKDEWNNTLVMTFSEFGRRVKQNGSGGTDHGKANNVFVLGGNLKKPGVYNDLPSLSKLDQGDLKHSIDFREVYSTILKKWLDADSANILGGDFDTHHFI